MRTRRRRPAAAAVATLVDVDRALAVFPRAIRTHRRALRAATRDAFASTTDTQRDELVATAHAMIVALDDSLSSEASSRLNRLAFAQLRHTTAAKLASSWSSFALLVRTIVDCRSTIDTARTREAKIAANKLRNDQWSAIL